MSHKSALFRKVNTRKNHTYRFIDLLYLIRFYYIYFNPILILFYFTSFYFTFIFNLKFFSFFILFFKGARLDETNGASFFTVL